MSWQDYDKKKKMTGQAPVVPSFNPTTHVHIPHPTDFHIEPSVHTGMVPDPSGMMKGPKPLQPLFKQEGVNRTGQIKPLYQGAAKPFAKIRKMVKI